MHKLSIRIFLRKITPSRPLHRPSYWWESTIDDLRIHIYPTSIIIIKR